MSDQQCDTAPMEKVEAEPIYARWATAMAERPTFEAVREPCEADGSIFASLYREKVLGLPASIPAQPARPDMRKLTCLTCGAPASPHKTDHDVHVRIPARQAKALP